jgi:hypothetical protein
LKAESEEVKPGEAEVKPETEAPVVLSPEAKNKTRVKKVKKTKKKTKVKKAEKKAGAKKAKKEAKKKVNKPVQKKAKKVKGKRIKKKAKKPAQKKVKGKKKLKVEPKPQPSPAKTPPAPTTPTPVEPQVVGGYTWTEIMAFPKREPKRELIPGSFASAINYLYKTGEPFEVLVTGFKEPDHPKTPVLRFFLHTRGEFAKTARAELQSRGLYASDAELPEFEAEFMQTLQLKTHFAVPVFDPRQQAENGQPQSAVSQLINALASTGGAFRVVAQGDTKAPREVESWVQGSSGFFSGVAGSAGDFAMGVGREIGRFDGVHEPEDVKSKQQQEAERRRLEVQRREAIAASMRESPLYACEVMVYGSGVQIENIVRALPAGANRFGAFGRVARIGKVKLSSPPASPPKCGKFPSRLWVKWVLGRSLRSVLLSLIPLLMVVVSLAMGWLPSGWINVIVLAVTPTLLLWYFWRVPKPIVLSEPQLAELVSIPPSFVHLALRQPPTLPAVEKEFMPEPEERGELRKGFVGPGAAAPEPSGEAHEIPTPAE